MGGAQWRRRGGRRRARTRRRSFLPTAMAGVKSCITPLLL